MGCLALFTFFGLVGGMCEAQRSCSETPDQTPGEAGISGDITEEIRDAVPPREMLIEWNDGNNCKGSFNKDLAMAHRLGVGRVLAEQSRIVGETGARWEALPTGTRVSVVAELDTFMREVRVLEGPQANRLFYVTEMCLESPESREARRSELAKCTAEEVSTFVEIDARTICADQTGAVDLPADQEVDWVIRRSGRNFGRTKAAYEKVQGPCGGMFNLELKRMVSARADELCPIPPVP